MLAAPSSPEYILDPVLLEHPASFLNSYGFIQDPSNPSLGTFSFQLWPWQSALLSVFFEHPRVVILKARQLGVSWLLAGYAMWLFLYRPGSTVLLVSKREHEAAEVLRKAVFIYRHLPESLHFQPHRRDVDSNIRFRSAQLESNLVALPATPDAARSWTATCVIPDEWALQEYAREMYASYEPTLGMSGQVIGCSTPQGPGGFFYEVWQAAKRRENGFLPVFLPWDLRPGRTTEWREEKARQMASQGTPELVGQEYPADELESFGASVNLFFPTEAVRGFLAGTEKPIEERMDGTWRVYKPPRFAGRYVIGADVAEGLLGGDFSTAVVLDAITGEHVSSLRCRVPPDLFGARLDEIGRYYHNAMVAVERNNHGILTLNVLQHQLRYPSLYFASKQSGRNGAAVPEPGWLTTSRTKPEMLLSLRQAMAEGSAPSPCSWFCSELQYFRQKGQPPERVEYLASPGSHDDMIIAMAIARAVRPVLGFQRGVRKTVPLSR